MDALHHSYAHAMRADHAAMGMCIGACPMANPWACRSVFTIVRKDLVT